MAPNTNSGNLIYDIISEECTLRADGEGRQMSKDVTYIFRGKKSPYSERKSLCTLD
jgi:hypothetical protein